MNLSALGGTLLILARRRAWRRRHRGCREEGGLPRTDSLHAGRVDASQAQTDVASFAFLEPAADAFRNYYRSGQRLSPPEMLVDRAKLPILTVCLLRLSAPPFSAPAIPRTRRVAEEIPYNLHSRNEAHPVLDHADAF
jgi:hypothetical protein